MTFRRRVRLSISLLSPISLVVHATLQIVKLITGSILLSFLHTFTRYFSFPFLFQFKLSIH